MKKLVLFCIFSLSLLIGTIRTVSAQCPGCVVNNACHPVGGGLCPDSLPAGTQGVYYDEDITCFLPTTFDAGPFSGGVLGIVPLLSVHIDAISGLPYGLDWTCNHPGNNFAPASGDTMGCVKICGTPLSAPGVYTITVAITAGIDGGPVLGTQYGQTSFSFQMVLLPNSSGNLAYNYSPGSACDSGTFTFTPNISFGLPQVTGYNWDFGGANVASVTTTTPLTASYNTPGDYPVTLVTTVYSLALTDMTVTASNFWWCGDVEEPNWPVLGCTAAPDLYFKFTHGSQTYTSSTAPVNATATWSNLNIPLSSTVAVVSFWDADPTSQDDDGGTSGMLITGPGVYGFSTTSPGGGGCSGNFVLGFVVDTIITVTDTMHVYASPAIPTITSSAASFCPGDSVMLTAPAGYSYQWFLADTVLVASTDTNILYVSNPGNYSVTIYDLQSNCGTHGPSITVTQNAAIPLTFNIVWSAANQWLQSNITTPNISYQWQTWNGSAWVNIPAPAGAQNHYTPPSNGQYALIAENAAGCSDTAYYTLQNLGVMDEELISNISIYPNPTTNSFTLDLQDVKAEFVTVSVISMMGQVVYQKEYEVNGGSLLETFDVYNYANGMYTVDIRIGNFNIRKKLIKN